jgi:Copper type II ascorbate-dependent monooxygenase, C-terminal domain/Secretion system C-terminal sorting domain
MKTLFLSIALFVSYAVSAQTWSDDVAQIVYDKCSKCHHTGGVGPFPLVTYAETSPMAAAMAIAITGDEMPPWPPENNYQSYSHDRSLSASEKTTLLDWITNGTPEGTPGNTPPPPVFQLGSVLGNGDLQIQIPTYMSKATASSDDYVCFALPSGLATSRVIKSVEIVPGNPEIVHHALIYLDPTGASVTDTIGGDCSGPTSTGASLVMGYTPGSSPMTLPSSNPLKLGIPFPANSQVYFAMHYPEGSYGLYDSTKVIFHFYPPGETGIRNVLTSPILQNWSFTLPPDQETNVSAQYPAAGGLPIDYSLLSVFPHMHLLGKSMKVYGIKPNLDTLKLINIPEWDFEWQDFYFYKNIQKAEVGAYLKVDAVYDNTSTNMSNPNTPPITVFPGLNTADEMCLVYMHYMLYQAGDETYNMDSLMNLSTVSLLEESYGESAFTVYPNPFNDHVNLHSTHFVKGDEVSVYIYDNQGKLIKKLLDKSTMNSSELHLQWDGGNETGEATKNGLYFISLNVNGQLSHQRVIKN